MNHPNIILSLDVGLHGGISVFDTVSKELLSVYPMPTKEATNKSGKEKSILDFDRLLFIMEIPKIHNDSCLVALEEIHAFGDAGFGIGVLMEQVGVVRGIAKALGYDEIRIPPKEWQKYFDLVPPKELKGTSAKRTKYLRRKWLKENSVLMAREVFPEFAGTKFKLKTCDGLTDSALLGKYVLTTQYDP